MPPAHNVASIIASIRARLVEREGENALRVAHNHLRGCGTVPECRRNLKDLGVRIADEDVEVLDANIDAQQLPALIVGKLSARRQLVVEEAFRRLCKVSDDEMPHVAALHEYFDASRHSAVKSRLKTADAVVADFEALWTRESNPSGVVTFEEFCAYYGGVSAGITADEEFELHVMRSWNLDRPHVSTRAAQSEQMNTTVQSKEGRNHPLYQTAAQHYGKNLEQAFEVPRANNRAGGFTKHNPPPRATSGLNTSSYKSKAI